MSRPSTYQELAQADANEVGGRFKKQLETRVTGVPEYPKQSANSPWSHDPVPNEPPLGYSIDALGGAGTTNEKETTT
jgi:hypothetical protein